MLTQLKLALRILRRRKFFTFISLFGISFTIMALVVIAAMGESALGDNPPLSKRDKLVFATHFRMMRIVPDTSYIVDSSLVAGVMTYDSTMQIGEEEESDSNSALSAYFCRKYLEKVSGAVDQSLSAPAADFDAYLSGRKVSFKGNYTDAAYWRLLDYEFTSGGPYSVEDVTAGALKVVITEQAADEYFGEHGSQLIGRDLDLVDKTYAIVGIVKTPAVDLLGIDNDVFLPITTAPSQLTAQGYQGPAHALFEAENPEGRKAIVDELARIATTVQPLPDSDNNRFSLEGLTFGEEFANSLRRLGEERHKSLGVLLPQLVALLIMIVVLPALNLMNINVSRVYERRSEIAVRKSFGATDSDILRQFVVETLVITLIGGLLGSLLALGLVSLINGYSWLGDFRLRFTGEVALYSLLVIVFFAFLTGLIPAWRMAQTRIATSLR